MTAPAPPNSTAAPGVEVVVLTNDPKFRDTVLAAAEEQRPVFTVRSLNEAVNLIGQRQPGVLITDAESLGDDPSTTLQRLHATALDLVVAVAVEPGGDPDVAALAERGEIFRTIRRPAGVGQTGLCIQAAAERHIELLMGESDPAPSVAAPLPAPAAAKERRRISLAAPLVGLALAAVTYMLMPDRLLRNEEAAVEPAPPTPIAKPEPSPSSGTITRQVEPLDPEVERLLIAGEEALAEGRLAPPDEDDAVTSFRAALVLAPDNERAQAGIDKVANALAAGAADALMQGRNEDASRLVREALNLRPESPQLTYLSRQIRQEEGRALIAKAREAAEANDWQTTVAYLDEATLLLGADARVASYNATDPFLARAEVALAEGNIARAEGIVEQIELVISDHPRVAPLKSAIADRKTQRAAARRRAAAEQAEAAKAQAEVQARIDALVASADESIEQGRLVGEGEDTALAQLRLARGLMADNPAVLDGFDRLTNALLARADAALEAGDYEAAERWVAEAGVLGKSPERVAAARDRIYIARRAEVSNTVIPAGQLNRLSYVPPEYPGRAWRLGVEGWVDVEFNVTRDGETSSITVVDAERRGYFEDAVVAAVEQWQYEPRVYEGKPIDQRVRLRINFERKLD
jgi:TonB family protein